MADSPTNQELWQQKAALAASALDFRRRATEALDLAVIGMFKTNSHGGHVMFKTEKGRPCRIALVVGDEPAAALDSAMEKILPSKEDLK